MRGGESSVQDKRAVNKQNYEIISFSPPSSLLYAFLEKPENLNDEPNT